MNIENTIQTKTLSHPLSLEELLSATRFAIEATAFEQSALWRAHHKTVEWEQILVGYGVHLGTLDNLPVMLGVTFARISGHIVLFHSATSLLADYRMVDKWLTNHVCATWDRGTRRARTDAQNFGHCLNALAELSALGADAAAQTQAAAVAAEGTQ